MSGYGPYSIDEVSMEDALLNTGLYTRRFTLFKRQYIESPIMYDLSLIQLPKFGTYHFIDMSGVQSGPQYADPLLTAAPGIKTIVHIKELWKPESTPIKVAGVNSDLLLTNYRRANRLIRPILEPERVEKDDRGILIYNYSLLAQEWRYPTNFRSEFLKWSNIYRTIYHTLNQVIHGSERQQYLDLTIPDRIPKLAKLREFVRSKSTESIKYLGNSDAFLIADLFCWVSEDREHSLLSMLDETKLDKINFIIRKNNNWVILNLGWLNQIRDTMDNKLLAAKLLLMFNRMADIASILNTDVPEEQKRSEDSEDDDNRSDTSLDELTSDLATGFIDDDDDVSEAGLLDDVADLAKTEKELEELDDVRESIQSEYVDDDINSDVVRYDVDGYVHTDNEQSAFLAKAEELASRNNITPAAYNRLARIATKFETIQDPYGSDASLIEAMEFDEKDIIIEEKVISDDDVVLDPSMKKSRIDAFHEHYLSKFYKKQLMAAVTAIQNFPCAITDYKIIDKSDASSSIEEHVVKVVPAVGESSVLRIPVFKIDPDGSFLYSGTRYRMRGQRADLPLRKISPSEVVISSHAAKCFINRSQRSRFNAGKWISEFLMAEATNSESTAFKNPNIARVVRYDIKLPWMYTTIANNLAGFDIDNIHYVFDYNRRAKLLNLTDEELKLEKKGSVIVARDKQSLIIMQSDDELVKVTNGLEEPFSDFETLLGMESEKAPLPMAEMKIYSKMVPLGVCLGYLIGLSDLLKLMRVKVRRALPGERLNLESWEYTIRFKNETLILDSRDRRNTLIMSGWKHIESTLKQYDIALFDNQDVYYPALDRAGIPSRYLKELDTMNVGFLDPMTKDLLMNMGEPIDFVPLLIRAVELILDEYVPTKRDDSRKLIELTERVRGYERIPGMVYETIYKAMRAYSARAARSDAKIVINPQEVLNAVISDPTVAPANNINPVHSLREREVLTFGGKGGRSKRAMVAKTRLYSNEDIGFISEATVDSGDVGIITYLAPNANITTIYGTARLYDKKRDGESMLLSTSSQLAFGADGDVPKRMGFISIQLGHQIATVDNDVQPARTGGERTMISRMGKMFGAIAESEGKVVEKTDKRVVIEYKDGIQKSFMIGDIEVSAEGTFYPHKLVSALEVGEKVKKGDVIYYNSGFFKPSPIDKGKVDYMFGLLALVAFREANYTLEDSCAITESFSNRMKTNVTKVKSKVIDFDQEVSNVLKVGDVVDLNTPLMRIEDAFTQDMAEDELAQALRHFSSLNPEAGVVGVVNRVEVFFNGDPDEMSDTLRRVTERSERIRKEEAKAKDETFYPNKVSRYVRIDGHQVESRQAMIVFHITLQLGMGVMDKLVFANQLKSTVGKVLFGSNTTLDGEELDAIFGALSGINRTVTSVYKAGGLNTYLTYVGEDAYKLYHS